MRRLRRAAISPQMFVEAMIHGLRAAVVVENGLPEGTEYAHSAYDFNTDTVWVFVRHESFADVPDGQPVPEHPLTTFRSAP